MRTIPQLEEAVKSINACFLTEKEIQFLQQSIPAN
jgi:hypothetical protein